MLSNPASKLVWGQRTTVLMVGLAVMGALLLMVGLLAPRAQAAPSTFIVNTTGDENDLDFPDGLFDGTSDGVCDVDAATAEDQCTLRAAIQEANVNNNPADQDQIEFEIGGASATGVKTISPTSELPDITERVTIDGYTQPGSQPNTLEVGNNAVLNIELDGTNAGNALGLEVSGDASNCVIRGLVINDFGAAGIFLLGDGRTTIEGNFIGTDPSGTQAQPNGSGAEIQDRLNTIGGTTPQARNLISGNDSDGVFLGFQSGNKVMGNYIGTQRDGKTRLGNDGEGVDIFGSSNNLIGGGTAAGANTIAFNADNGILIREEDPFVADGNRIRINSIHSNELLGIDLGDDRGEADGRTPNDAKDTDEGPNTLQNKPVLTSATSTGSHITIEGRLSSTPSSTFTIRFFTNPLFAPFGYEGRRYIGVSNVSTDANGEVTFSRDLAVSLPAGQVVTATATGTGPGGNTSEFSDPRRVVQQ
jgi:CSLREA domain-containing protein